ncbi:MAG: DUF6171 family protein [Phycisphaerales bacterium]
MSCCGNRVSVMSGAVRLLQSEIGIGVASDEIVADRRRACESCDRWDHGRCRECGCFTFAKTKLRSERCPLGKWGAVDA